MSTPATQPEIATTVLNLCVDLDGTLVDSAIDIMNAANEVMSESGLKPLSFEKVKSHIGEGFAPFIREVAGRQTPEKALAEKIFNRFQNFYDKRILENTDFFDGVRNCIKVRRSAFRALGVIAGAFCRMLCASSSVMAALRRDTFKRR